MFSNIWSSACFVFSSICTSAGLCSVISGLLLVLCSVVSVLGLACVQKYLIQCLFVISNTVRSSVFSSIVGWLV